MKKNCVFFSEIRAILKFILLHRVHRAGFEWFFGGFLVKTSLLNEPDVEECRDVCIRTFSKTCGFGLFGDVLGCRGEVHRGSFERLECDFGDTSPR